MAEKKIELVGHFYETAADLKNNIGNKSALLKQLMVLEELSNQVVPEMSESVKSIKACVENNLEGFSQIADKFAGMSERVCQSLIRREDTYSDYIVENYFSTNYSKNALIIYIVYPFVIRDNNPGHTNQLEAMEMARALRDRGYNVDVVNTRYEDIQDEEKYDLVVGYGRLFDKMCHTGNGNRKHVCYLTERNPQFANNAEVLRWQYFEKRNGVKLGYERHSSLFGDLEALMKADGAICIGNQNTADTYKDMFKKIVPINVSGFDNNRLPQLNRSDDCSKNFLWYGGAGALHKGLDLCIEAFRNIPECNLYIVGQPSVEFYEFYRDDIENAENVLYYGFLSKESPEFEDVCSKCGFCLMPSCSEGQSTAVVTTLFAGMIPVCTRETGIDAKEIGGFWIDDITVEKLATQIKMLSAMDMNELKERSLKVYEYAIANHTLHKYREGFEEALSSIINVTNLKKPVKVQFLNGGLANQVFQYLFARYYELSNPGEIMYLDDSYFANNTVHNGYELEKVFGIKPHMLSSLFETQEWMQIVEERRLGKSIATIFNERYGKMVMVTEVDNYGSFNPFDGQVMPIPANGYYPEIMQLTGNVYYHGYWINKEWFREFEADFRKELKFPEISKDERNWEYMDEIIKSNSLAVHVRRGDYVNLGIALSAGDFKKMCQAYAARYSGDWTVFVFSDDVQWCRENSEEMGLNIFKKIVYVEGNVAGNNYRDMQLMSKCKGMIMSNSAFCYLAALLRENDEFVLNATKREL